MKKPYRVSFTVTAKYSAEWQLTDQEVEALENGESSGDDLMQRIADRNERNADVEYNFNGASAVAEEGGAE